MHSCGYIYEIIEDLIELGMDVLQFGQPALYGIERLGREFGGRITFWCPVEIYRQPFRRAIRIRFSVRPSG